MTKLITLRGPAIIKDLTRYPNECPMEVDDAEAERLAAAGLLEDEEDGADADDDGLAGMKVADLTTLASEEGVDLNGATRKDDIIAAIRAKRADAPA